jgi:pre-mRNA-splicing factor SYF1
VNFLVPANYCTVLFFQLWNELCQLIAENPDKVTSLKIEPIIRQGLKRYTDQIATLWNSLADYYIRGAHMERVRHFSF